MKRSGFIKRGTRLKAGKRLTARKVSKRPTVEGDSERAIRDEMDQIVRDLIAQDDENYCIVCGIPGEHEELHPGHYITRKVFALRWDMRNVWPQCNPCNSEHNENPAWYRSMLVMQIGGDEVLELERIGQENPELQYVDLLTIRDGLRRELAARTVQL